MSPIGSPSSSLRESPGEARRKLGCFCTLSRSRARRTSARSRARTSVRSHARSTSARSCARPCAHRKAKEDADGQGSKEGPSSAL